MAISPPRVALSVRPRDPTGLWNLLRWCVFATIGLSALSAVANGYEAVAAPYDYESNLAARIWFFWYAYAGYAQWSIFLLSLLFLLWLTYRLARNLHALAPNKFLISPTYAAGYYLVPIANIIMPPRITGLIARATFAASGTPHHHNALIGWWWGTFLLAALLSNVATAIAINSGAYNPDMSFNTVAYNSSLIVGVAAWITNFASCYFMLRVFSPIVRAQANLIREHTAS